MSDLLSPEEAIPENKASESELNNEEVAVAEETRTKIKILEEIDEYMSEIDIARISTFLSADQIKKMGKHAINTVSEKLAVIGQFYKASQIEYIGPMYFAHPEMTPKKIQLIGSFTNDQLEAFCIDEDSAGRILAELEIAKLHDLGRLSPETILMLTHNKKEELIISSHGSLEWNALMNYNIDYPMD
jgi:hypothetical protein